MALLKHLAIHRHIITHHHVIVDRLVRLALIMLAVILLGGFFFLRLTNPGRGIRTIIVGSDTLTLGNTGEFALTLENNGKRLTGGAALTITAGPGLRVTALNGSAYPANGLLVLPRVDVGATIRLPVRAMADAVGDSWLSFVVRDPRSGTVLAEESHVLTVVKPELRPTVSVRYFSPEGEQLGRGPLPPQVGESTTYYALMQMTPGRETWRNIEMSAELGPQVAWSDFVPQHREEIRYDRATNRVVWQPENLVVSDADVPRAVGIAFGITLTPHAAMAGRTPVLLTSIRARATAPSGEHVDTALPEITTELLGDEKAAGRGQVVP